MDITSQICKKVMILPLLTSWHHKAQLNETPACAPTYTAVFSLPPASAELPLSYVLFRPVCILFAGAETVGWVKVMGHSGYQTEL